VTHRITLQAALLSAVILATLLAIWKFAASSVPGGSANLDPGYSALGSGAAADGRTRALPTPTEFAATLCRQLKDGFLAALGGRLHARSGTTIGASGQPVPSPEACSTAPCPGEVEIAVIAAPVSGLPLNHELTRPGGRILRAVSTYPDYRLFVLPGGPSLRPSLLHCEPEMGASIATEIWAQPLAGLGDFVAGIPAPLCIGTLKLADGTHTKGLLVESTTAEIALFGGWRAYLASYRMKSSDSAPTNASRATLARLTIAADA
jgi:allophanate hydrolase